MKWRYIVDIETEDNGLEVTHEFGEMVIEWLKITRANSQIKSFNVNISIPNKEDGE